MDYEYLMILTCAIIVPLKYREYFFGGDWENRAIPRKDADNFIAYHRRLEELIKTNDAPLFRKFIESNSEMYEDELTSFLRLKDNELLLVLKNIGIETSSGLAEGHA
jgi:hypothetical protein